ncbi:PQQ-dependent sugar dehydrogenase [Lacinutrix undariae]
MKHFLVFIVCLFFTFSNAQSIDLEIFATGFSNPVNIKHADDSNLYVVERAGVIKKVLANGEVASSPLLNISQNVNSNTQEQGLLGLAFHPQYIENGFFYVNYINDDGNTVISRFTKASEISANPLTELILLTVTQPYANHNGGDLAFGPNGYLHIAIGDGGSGGDPDNNAQDLTTHLGKLLRIDIDNTSHGKNYAIPETNPFPSTQNPNALPEIWAYGLRNPWKFSFDFTTNELWIADVGQSSKEEINKVSTNTAGINYGWRCYEGSSSYNALQCPEQNSITFPIGEYNYGGNPYRCSITGGYRYRGTSFSDFIGLYFFADYCSNEIGVLSETDNTWSLNFVKRQVGNGWSCFGEDSSGELYIGGLASGIIYKLQSPSLQTNDNFISKIKMYPNPTTDQFTLEFSANYTEINSVEIFNIHGKLIKSITNFESQLKVVNTKTFSSGMYLISIKNKSGNKTIKKLIIG